MMKYGAIYDNYSWDQTETNLTINILFPKEIKRKDLNIKILSYHLVVGVKGEVPVIDGDFPHRVIAGVSIWYIVDGQFEFILEKSQLNQDIWWKSAIVGDPEIDVPFYSNPLDSDLELSWERDKLNRILNETMISDHLVPLQENIENIDF